MGYKRVFVCLWPNVEWLVDEPSIFTGLNIGVSNFIKIWRSITLLKIAFPSRYAPPFTFVPCTPKLAYDSLKSLFNKIHRFRPVQFMPKYYPKAHAEFCTTRMDANRHPVRVPPSPLPSHVARSSMISALVRVLLRRRGCDGYISVTNWVW